MDKQLYCHPIMKALVLKEYMKFVYQDHPTPTVGPTDVLIKVKACGICGSDVHGMDGSTGRRQPPIIMGHEAAGIIADLGNQVKNWKKGDRVTFDSTVYCGTCRFCHQGQINLCDNRRVLGVSCNDYCQHGAFADYVVIPQHILYRLPDNITFQQAAMIESLSIAAHAVNRTPFSGNHTAVVVGTGMIGLLVVQCLRAAGCDKIIAVDIEQEKLDLARKLGADFTLKADACNAPDEIHKITSGQGADITFEVVGIDSTIETAVHCLRKGGSLILVGNLSPKISLPLQSVVTRELNLIGSCASCGEYPDCLDMIARNTVNVDALISATVPLAQGAEWFDRLYKKQPGLMKVILIP